MRGRLSGELEDELDNAAARAALPVDGGRSLQAGGPVGEVGRGVAAWCGDSRSELSLRSEHAREESEHIRLLGDSLAERQAGAVTALRLDTNQKRSRLLGQAAQLRLNGRDVLVAVQRDDAEEKGQEREFKMRVSKLRSRKERVRSGGAGMCTSTDRSS